MPEIQNPVFDDSEIPDPIDGDESTKSEIVEKDLGDELDALLGLEEESEEKVDVIEENIQDGDKDAIRNELDDNGGAEEVPLSDTEEVLSNEGEEDAEEFNEDALDALLEEPEEVAETFDPDSLDQLLEEESVTTEPPEEENNAVVTDNTVVNLSEDGSEDLMAELSDAFEQDDKEIDERTQAKATGRRNEENLEEYRQDATEKAKEERNTNQGKPPDSPVKLTEDEMVKVEKVAMKKAKDEKEKDREDLGDDAIDGIAEEIWDNPEILEKKKEQLKKVFERKNPSSPALGFAKLHEEYLRALVTDDQEKIGEIKEMFQAEGFSEEETEKILAFIKSKEFGNKAKAILRTEEQIKLIDHDIKKGTNYYAKSLDVIANAEDDEDAQNKFDKFMEEAVEENEELAEEMKDVRELFERTEETEELYEEFQKQEAGEVPEAAEQPALSNAATVMLIEAGVTQSVINDLPPEGLAAIESVVDKGGAKVLGTLLANGVSLNDEAFVGKISGQHVSLSFSDRSLFLVGENAADRANQSFYKIDPPTPAGFEKILIHSVGEQNRMPYIAQHGQQAGIIWERLVGDPNDKSFPEAQSINRFRNFLVLLIGEGNPDAEGEGDRLEQLGIITQGVDSVNRSRVDLFVEALEKFVPGGLVMHEGDSPITSDESPGFNFQDALTLAMLWDDNDSDMPDDLGDLKKLTDRRISGDDITEVGYA